jgi:hypothetical protein
MARLLCFSLVVLAIPACTVRPSGHTESSAAECSNGRDDDGDGHVDCDDQDCDAICVAGGGDSGTMPMPDAQFTDTNHTSGCFDPIDLVFVLDVSTSMMDEFTHLREGIASIYAAADALTHDHTFGLIVFVDDVLVVNGCSSFASATDLQAEFDTWRSFCSSNGNPGGASQDNSDCPENSLDALYDAATMCTWRPGATHIAIHVTDDTFRESPARFGGPGGVQAMHTYQQTLDALVAAQVRVGAFAQSTPAFCGAGTSANTAQGFFVSYNGATPLPDATNGRVWDIADVRSGSLDMATSINELIAASHCQPF